MITPAQCRAARAWLKLSQGELAELAGCGVMAVMHFETEKAKTILVIIAAIQQALEQRGASFSRMSDGAEIIRFSVPA